LHDSGPDPRQKGANAKDNDKSSLSFGGDPVDTARKSGRLFGLRYNQRKLRRSCDRTGGGMSAEGIQNQLLAIEIKNYSEQLETKTIYEQLRLIP
jgi:hypothetical protein